MKNYYIDTHTHPFKEYYEDPDLIVKEWYEQGIKKMFVVGTDITNSKETLDLAEKHDFIYPIIGVHPYDAWSEELVKQIRQMWRKDIVAIGEVGLDYKGENIPSKELQIRILEKFIDLALEKNVPIVFHIREAHEDLYNMLLKRDCKKLKFLFHTYSANWEWAQKFLNLGAYFSFSGVVTFKNAKLIQEVASKLPLEKILVETDTPYLTPVPFRGQPNNSTHVKEVANFIANLRNISIEEFNNQIYKNALIFFNLNN